MDARIRLNELRKQNFRLKRKKIVNNKTKLNVFKNQKNRNNSLTDLRQLINNDNYNNSVKNRIGFKTNKKLNRKQTLVSDNNQFKNKQNVKQTQKKLIRISMSGKDERIPKVMVKLSEVEDNSVLDKNNKINVKTRNRTNTSKSFSNRNLNSSRIRRERNSNRGLGPIVSNQPLIIPQIVPQTSVPTYLMSSSAAINPISQSFESIDDFNETLNTNNTVLVTNLNKSITQQDLDELFGEIGSMVKASKINPSVAVIVYRNSIDARNACHTYHNRLLDGMPMQCNILSHSHNEYTLESMTRTQSASYGRQSLGLLESQLRQINSSQTNSKLTAAQAFANSRKGGNNNVRFTVNV